MLECVRGAVRGSRYPRVRARAAVSYRCAPLVPRRRSEYQRNKDVVIGMLLQVSLNIDNPFGDGK